MTKTYLVGFIGGSIYSAVGKTHKIALELDRKFKVVAGCFSLNKEENESTGKEYQIEKSRVYSNHNLLLSNEKGKLDLIVILSPTNLHKEHVLQALQHGYKVVCEKALACNLKEANEIQKQLNNNLGFLKVIYNYQGYPMVRELKELIKGNKLGKIQQIFAEMPQEGFERVQKNNDPIIPQNWRLKDGDIPVISLDLGVHLHMLIKYLSQEKPICLSAISSTYGNFKNIIDNVNCICKYTNDVNVSLWFGKTALGIRNGLKIRIFGSKGSAEWIQEDPEKLKFSDCFGNISILDRGSPTLKIANQNRYQRFKPGHPSGFIEAFSNYYVDIAESLDYFIEFNKHNVNEECFGIEESIEGLKMLEKISFSSEKKEWINF